MPSLLCSWKYKEQLNHEDLWLEKEVQYKKWVAAYKLGLHDGKVSGNGAHDQAAAHLMYST